MEYAKDTPVRLGMGVVDDSVDMVSYDSDGGPDTWSHVTLDMWGVSCTVCVCNITIGMQK